MSNLIQNEFTYNNTVLKTIFCNEKIYTEFNSFCKNLKLSESYYYKKFNSDKSFKGSFIKEYTKGNNGLRKKIFIDITYLDLVIENLSNSYHNQNYDFIKQNLNNIIKDMITFYTNKNFQFLEMKKQGQEIIKIVLDDKEFFCFERQKDSKIYLPLKHTIDILGIEVNDCINFFQHNKHLTTSLKRITNNKISLLLIDLDLLDDLIKSLKSVDTNYSFKIKSILNERKYVKIPKTYVDTLVKFLKVEDENAKLEMENINLKLEIEELKEKAQMYDNSLSVVNLQDMKQISSVFGIGRNSLFNFLRNRNVLIEGGKDHNLPYQKYIDSGYFIVRRVVINRTSGKELKNQTLVTAKGLGFLNRIIKNNQTNLLKIAAN